MPCPAGDRMVAFTWGDLNPLKWLGKGASVVVGDVWKAAMTALWSAGLWILQLAFKIIDSFTTPDLSESGPLGEAYRFTFGIGATVAGVLVLMQLGSAAVRRDGASLGRVLVGVGQFGAVWVGYVGCAAAVVVASGSLTRGLLQGLLHVDGFAGWASASDSWPRQVDDVVVATVLGLSTVFLIFPAAVGYLLIMLVREAALMLLVATSPIAAAGLLSDGTKAWFWKTLRWSVAAVLVAPLSALVLGIGVQVTRGIVRGDGDQTVASVGMAVVGSVLIMLGAVCPLVLFRLLAFVDPGTTSGAAMREAFAAQGGLAGVLSGRSGGGRTSGSGASVMTDGLGRAQGEATADGQTAGRFAGLAATVGGAVGTAAAITSGIGSRAAAIGADVLAGAGIGNQAPYFGQERRAPASPVAERDLVERPAEPEVPADGWGTPPPPPSIPQRPVAPDGPRPRGAPRADSGGSPPDGGTDEKRGRS